MDRLKELIEVLSNEEVIMNTKIAKTTGRCKICNQPARSFRSPFSRLEYSISQICQSCQDYYYLNSSESSESHKDFFNPMQ